MFYRLELQEKTVRLQSESEQALQQLEEAELKAAAAFKQAGQADVQLAETQTQLEEETKHKLSLQLKLKQLESDKEALQEQIEEEEEAKRGFEKQVCIVCVSLKTLKMVESNLFITI